MTDDDLATQGAGASAAMVLAYFPRNILNSAHECYTIFYFQCVCMCALVHRQLSQCCLVLKTAFTMKLKQTSNHNKNNHCDDLSDKTDNKIVQVVIFF